MNEILNSFITIDFGGSDDSQQGTHVIAAFLVFQTFKKFSVPGFTAEMVADERFLKFLLALMSAVIAAGASGLTV